MFILTDFVPHWTLIVPFVGYNPWFCTSKYWSSVYLKLWDEGPRIRIYRFFKNLIFEVTGFLLGWKCRRYVGDKAKCRPFLSRQANFGDMVFLVSAHFCVAIFRHWWTKDRPWHQLYDVSLFIIFDTAGSLSAMASSSAAHASPAPVRTQRACLSHHMQYRGRLVCFEILR